MPPRRKRKPPPITVATLVGQSQRFQKIAVALKPPPKGVLVSASGRRYYIDTRGTLLSYIPGWTGSKGEHHVDDGSGGR